MNEYRLGDLFKIKHGFAFKSENYVEKSEYRLITLGNFTENNDFKFNDSKATYYGGEFPEDFILNDGDLVIPLTEQVIGLFGNTAFVPKSNGNYKFVLNQRVGKVIINELNVDKYYLHYLLATNVVKKQLEARASGTRQRNLSPEKIYDIKVKIPDIITQRKIGKLLYNIETMINCNVKISDKIENILRLAYNRWFLQYEFPNEDGKPYFSNGGKMVWNNKMKSDIPLNWHVENLYSNTLTNIISPGVDNFDKKNYLATSNVNGNTITDGKWITFESRESRANMQPIFDSVWFAKLKNSIKHISLSNKSSWFIDKYILSTGFLGLECKKSLSYIHCFINSNFFEIKKDSLSHGATQEGINNDDLKSFNFIVPTDEVLEKFEDKFYKYIIFINNLERENQNLLSLKNFLLPLLMNGQISFKD